MGEVMEHRDCMRPIPDPKDPDEQYASARGFFWVPPVEDPDEFTWSATLRGAPYKIHGHGLTPCLWGVYRSDWWVGPPVASLRRAIDIALAHAAFMDAWCEQGPTPEEWGKLLDTDEDYAEQMGWVRDELADAWMKAGRREVVHSLQHDDWDISGAGKHARTLRGAIDWCERNPVEPPKPAVNFDCTPIELDPEPPMVQGRVDVQVGEWDLPAEEGRKDDDGKPRTDLLSWRAIMAESRVLYRGAVEYGAESWRNVPDAQPRYYAAAIRHLAAWWVAHRFGIGSKIDDGPKGTGESHLACARASIGFLFEFDQEEQP